MAKAILEADGKALLFKYFRKLAEDGGMGKDLELPFKAATINPDTNIQELAKLQPWMESEVCQF